MVVVVVAVVAVVVVVAVVAVVVVVVADFRIIVMQFLWDCLPGERRRADRPGAKCTTLAAEGR